MVLIVVGILILWLIVHTVVHWFPAVIAAAAVYLIWHSLVYAAGAFFLVALLMVFFRHR